MFKGSMPALVTPFTPDGELDLDTLKKLVEWHVEQGSHAELIAAGGLYARLWARQTGGFVAADQ